MFTVNSTVNATIKKPTLIELNMTVPWDTDTYYEMAIATTVVGGLADCASTPSIAPLPTS